MKARPTSKPDPPGCHARWPVTIRLLLLALWLAGCTTDVSTPESAASTVAPTATIKATHEIALAEPVITATPAATVTPAPTQGATKLPTQPGPTADLGLLMNATPAPTSIPLPPLPERLDYELNLVKQLGGRATAMAINGDLAYDAVGPRLVVVNLSEPTAPTEIGRSDMLPAPILLMAVDGTDAFVLTKGNQGLFQLDLTTPEAPAIAAAVNLPEDALALGERQFVKLVVAGENLYLGERQWAGDRKRSALHRLDRSLTPASSWSTPTVVEGTLAGLVPLPGYLYLLTNEQLFVLQLSADGDPILIAEYANEFAAHDGLIIDEQLYLLGWQMTIMDVTNPWEPLFLRDLWQSPYSVVQSLIVGTDQLLVASYGGDVVSSSGLWSIRHDALTSDEWERIHLWRENERIVSMAKAGETVVVLTEHGLYLFDLLPDDATVLVGRWATMGDLTEAFPAGDSLITGSITGEHLDLWRLSEPEWPEFAGEIPGMDWGGPMTLEGSTLSVPSVYGSLRQYDLLSGSSDRIEVGPALVGLTINRSGHYLFGYAYGFWRLLIVDANEQTVVATLDDRAETPWWATAFTEQFFVTTTGWTLQIYDFRAGVDLVDQPPQGFSDGDAVEWSPLSTLSLPPSNHRLVSIGSPTVSRLTISDHYVYVLQQVCDETNCLGELKIVNIAEPTEPRQVAAYELEFAGRIEEMAVAEGRLILVGREMLICDLASPEMPTVMARLILPADPVLAHSQADYLYVSALQWGLLVLRLFPT
ncbi:MAG: hypothetical protein KDE34_20400 [Anaerolineales bacterium]|nr:hypothetical protein [Anaerolineales bacterium]